MNIIEDIKNQYRTGGIVQKLIFWNIGLYLLSLIFFYNFSFGNFNFPSWLALYSNFDDFIFSPWTLFSYMFLHAGFLHLLFNMMVLHFSGRLFETYFTQKQLFGLYILGGIFSGIAFLVSFILIGKASVLVGASGAIMALLILEPKGTPLLTVAFECFSAFSTVGLSLNFTPTLSEPSKYVIIATMFIGRIGMLNLMIGLLRQMNHQFYEYPRENILIN